MKVVTHSGSFQADEVFAIAVLKLIHGDKMEVIRSRNLEVLSQADMRVDVGQKYDPETNDFDHHQTEGAGSRESGIPYSSAGLIWKHFGMQLVDNEDQLRRLDDKIFQAIDADDNGVMAYEPTLLKPYTLPTMVKAFNPSWQDQDADYDKAFHDTVEIAMKILQREIHKVKGFDKAQQMTLEAIKKSDGKIVILEEYCPWKKTVVEESEAKFVVYPSFNGEWKAQTVPVSTSSFEAQVPFPKEWAGLEGEELDRASGVDGCVFCHRGLFIAGTKTKEGAIQLAKIALEKEH